MAVKNLRQQTIFDGYGDINAGIMGDMGYSDQSRPPALSAYDPPDPIGNMDPSQDPNNEFSKYVSNDISGISDVSGVSKIRLSAVPFDKTGELKKYTDLMNGIYTPSTRSDDRLNNLLDNAPSINDYEPSFARKLVSGLQSIKDPTQGQKTLNQPYLQDMGEWTAKTAPFQAAASSENARNTNERTLAGNIVSNMTIAEKNYQLQQQAEERNRITEENNKMRDEVAKTRNNIERFKAAKLQVEVRGSRVIGYRPDGSSMDLGSSRGLDEIDAITAKGEQQVKAAAAMGSGVFQDAKGNTWRVGPNGNWIPMQGPPGAEGQPPQAGPSGPVNRVGTPNSTTTHTAEDIRVRNDRMKQYYDTDPNAKQFMSMGTTGVPEMKKRPVVGETGFWPFNKTVTQQQVDDYDAVRKTFFPDYVPPAGLAPSSAPPNPNPASAAPASAGPMGPTKPPALPAAGQPAQPVNAAPTQQGPISQQPQVPASKPAMQTEVSQLTRQLNDPMVPDASKQAIFDRIQFLNKQIESTPSQTPWLWDQAKNAGSAVAGSMKVPEPGQVQENVYQKQVMTPNGPVTVPPGKVAIRNLETGEIVQIPAENLQKAIQTGKFVGVK